MNEPGKQSNFSAMAQKPEPRRILTDEAKAALVMAKVTELREAFADAGPSKCSCHPDDKPPVPCPQKYALTHCRAADLGRRLRRAISTSMNDDNSAPMTEERKRHMDRLDAMSAAAAFLEDRW